MKQKTEDSTKSFKKGVRGFLKRKYTLSLYVAGNNPKSRRAIENIKKICEEDLKGRCFLKVIDIYKRPVLAKGEQIIATPTLVKKIPLPLRKFIGDLSDKNGLLLGLDLKTKK